MSSHHFCCVYSCYVSSVVLLNMSVQGVVYLANTVCKLQVKNLRSQVSQLAMVCLRELYANLKKNMDSVCMLADNNLRSVF